MDSYLYKVSPPRSDMVFRPSPFWHTDDWESSTTRGPRDGYVEDSVLYAGDFDEVTIHLFPRVRTMRVRSIDADAEALNGLGLPCSSGRRAHVFVEESRRPEVEAFRPTVFRFERAGFTRVRRGEYVSWRAQIAMGSETLSLAEALVRWNVEARFVNELDEVIARLRGAGVYFEIQT